MRLKHFLIPCVLSFATVFTCAANQEVSLSGCKQETIDCKSVRTLPALVKHHRMNKLGLTPKISMDGSGNVLAVWIQAHSLYASVRSVNQAEWSKPEVIANSSVHMRNLNVINNANGQFAAIWVEQMIKGGSTVSLSILSDIHSNWSAPVVLSDENNRAQNPAVAINSTGEILAAWEENVGAIHVIKYAKYSKSNGWTQAIQASSTDRNARLPSVSIDEQGNGAVMWIRYSPGSKPAIEVASLPNDGSWVCPVDLESEKE